MTTTVHATTHGYSELTLSRIVRTGPRALVGSMTATVLGNLNTHIHTIVIRHSGMVLSRNHTHGGRTVFGDQSTYIHTIVNRHSGMVLSCNVRTGILLYSVT